MKSYYKVTVRVVGLKKKGRKEDVHTFLVGHFPYTPELTPEQMEEFRQVTKGVVDTNMRRTENRSYRINLDYVEIEKGFETWEPFSDKHKQFTGVASV